MLQSVLQSVFEWFYPNSMLKHLVTVVKYGIWMLEETSRLLMLFRSPSCSKISWGMSLISKRRNKKKEKSF